MFIPIISEVGIIISSTTSSSIPRTEDSIFLYCFGIRSPDSSSNVLSSSVLRLSLRVESFASNLNIFNIRELEIEIIDTYTTPDDKLCKFEEIYIFINFMTESLVFQMVWKQ